MKYLIKLLVIFSAVGMLTGCASILTTTRQKVTVQTSPAVGATCTLSNSKGQWYIPSTPATVMINKSYGNLTVSCQKVGYQDAQVSVRSRTGVAVFGNVILGGVPGVCIDCMDGAAYHYPDNIQVPMMELRRH